MRSMVELAEDGTVAARRGAPNDDLADATPNFLRVGTMLGRSLGLDDFIEMRVVCDDETLTFASSGGRRVGVAHHAEPAKLYNLDHGT